MKLLLAGAGLVLAVGTYWLVLALRDSSHVWVTIASSKRRPYDEKLALRLK